LRFRWCQYFNKHRPHFAKDVFAAGETKVFELGLSLFELGHSMFECKHSLFEIRHSMFEIRHSMFDCKHSLLEFRHFMFEFTNFLSSIFTFSVRIKLSNFLFIFLNSNSTCFVPIVCLNLDFLSSNLYFLVRIYNFLD
jgi:hypothetical protein